MGKIIWSLWARYQGIVASVCLQAGGVIAIFYSGNVWIPPLSICLSVLIAFLEFPHSLTKKLGPVSRILYFRSFLYILASAPMYLTAPTTTGALTLSVTGIVYLMSAINKEEFDFTVQCPDQMSFSQRPKMIVGETMMMKPDLKSMKSLQRSRTLCRQPGSNERNLGNNKADQNHSRPKMDSNLFEQPSEPAFVSKSPTGRDSYANMIKSMDFSSLTAVDNSEASLSPSFYL